MRHGVNDRTSVIVPIEGARELGRGRGIGKEAVIARSFSPDVESSKTLEFAVKTHPSAEMAQHDKQMYERCRVAGLPVAITFGIDEEDPRITYSTDLSLGGMYAVESSTNDKYNPQEIKNISNIKELAHEIVWSAIFAAAANANLIHRDVVFFQFVPGGQTAVHIVFNDFQHIIDDNYTTITTRESRAQRNTRTLLNAVDGWLFRRNTSNRVRLTNAISREVERILDQAFMSFSAKHKSAAFPVHHERSVISRIPRRNRGLTRFLKGLVQKLAK